MKRFMGVTAAFLVFAAGTAAADDPNSTGVPEKGCDPIKSGSIYVGATNMSCSNARPIAAKGLKGIEPKRWNCTGLGTAFGHCHGARGRIAHWAVND